MLKATYICFRETPGRNSISGWYVTDALGAMIDGARRHEDEASCLRSLSAMSG